MKTTTGFLQDMLQAITAIESYAIPTYDAFLEAEDIQFVIGAEGKPTAVLVDIAF